MPTSPFSGHMTLGKWFKFSELNYTICKTDNNLFTKRYYDNQQDNMCNIF